MGYKRGYRTPGRIPYIPPEHPNRYINNLVKSMKHIRKTRKALTVLKNKNSCGVNSFGLVYVDKPTVYHVGKVCYNALNFENPRQIKGHGPVSFISVIRHLPHQLSDRRPLVEAYLDWVFNDSPFHSVFFTKSGAEALDKGMICHTDVSACLLIGGLSLPREVNECASKILLWGDLVINGMSPIHAYVATYYIDKLHGLAFQVKKPPYNTNHLPLAYPLTPQYIRNFLLGRIQDNEDRHDFRVSTNFMGVFGLWGSQHNQETLKLALSRSPQRVEVEGWGGEPMVSELLVYKTREDRMEFARDFTKQMKEICDG